MNCKSCPTKLTGRQTKFCSVKCKNKFFGASRFQLQRGIDIKIKLVEQKGGGCLRCGYKRNYAALCFHHRDPSTKKFMIDMNTLANRSAASVQTEIAKCDLLCANCHAEHHYPLYQNDGTRSWN
jgi:hypothetical protein